MSSSGVPWQLVPLAVAGGATIEANESALDCGAFRAGCLDALAVDSHWREIPGVRLIIRPSPRLLLSALGPFTPAHRARLDLLREQLAREQLEDSARTILSYQDVEGLCAELAERLIAHYGLVELCRFHFTALARGGYLVLGMLAYCLGLRRERLEQAPLAGQPWVAVDDCAITGLRFGEWLRGHGHAPVIFAPLYSHPELRANLTTAEPRVGACFSAADLNDQAPLVLGQDYPAWRADRLAAGAGQRYWVGQIEPLVFPWSEPERSAWNPVTQAYEPVWRLAPANLCLRNRRSPATGPGVPIDVMREPVGPWRVADELIYAVAGDEVLICDVVRRSALTLRASAATMWCALLDSPDMASAVAAVAQVYSADPERLAHDLLAFAEQLQQRGLLWGAVPRKPVEMVDAC
jgi:hypothetical protein